MYARRYDDRRGGINPPANYSGNAFSSDQYNENPASPEMTASAQADNVSPQEELAVPVGARSAPPRQNQEHGTPQYAAPQPINAPPSYQGSGQHINSQQYQNVSPPQNPSFQTPPYQSPPQFQNQPSFNTPPCDVSPPYGNACVGNACAPDACAYPPAPRPHGFLDGIFSRFGKDFSLEDILLIGFILLLSSGKFGDNCDGGDDDLLLILGLILIIGL